jgi:hypothetical protein
MAAGFNGNWGASMTATMIAIGVFTNDREKFNHAMAYFNSKKDGSLEAYIYPSGQCQETCRDVGHTQMGIGALVDVCEVAWKQGIDLYGKLDNRLSKGLEYSARVLLGEKVPASGCGTAKLGGGLNPTWEVGLNHYKNRAKISVPNTEQIAAKGRPEGVAFNTRQGWATLTHYNLPPLPKGYRPESTSPKASFSINLLPDWNLVSTPVEPEETSIPSLFSTINGKFQAIYSFGGEYKGYFPGEASNQLTSIQAGSGYWIYMSEAASVNITGSVAFNNQKLNSGWNLVGFNSQKELPVTVAIASLADKISALYSYNPKTNSYSGYIPGQTSDLKEMKPGVGYWLYVTEDTNWTLP